LIFVGGNTLWQTRTSGAPPLLPLPTSTGALIPVSGGNLFSEIDQTGYFFAPGTFTETGIFTHTIWSSAPLPPPGVIGLGGLGHAFEATALSAATGLPLQPTQPVTVTVDYGDSAPGPIISGTLCLWWMDANNWVRLPSQDDPIERQVTATVDHFSRFALFGETHSIFLPAVQRK
jgi:hypothetical protein